MDKYDLAKQRFEQKKKEHSHIDFDLLAFLPVIQDVDSLKQQRQKKFDEDLRVVRTKSIMVKPGEEGKEFLPFDEKMEVRLAKVRETAVGGTTPTPDDAS